MLDKKTNWEYLKKLYEFESSRVSGPGSYRRDINKVLWTLDDLKSALSLSSKESKEFEKLIAYLNEKREIMLIPTQNDKYRYITRVGETIRLLGHNYEYWFRGRQGIDSVRWLVEEKKIPVRDILAEAFIDELLSTVVSQIADDFSTFNLRKAIEIVIKGIASSFEQTDWKKATFSDFQLQTAKEMLLAQYKPDYKLTTQVLTAGVGSGKTIAFSAAMLISAVEGILSGEKTRRTHLFLYPRRALAIDQYRTLERIVSKIGLQQLTVHFEHYHYYEDQRISVKDGIAKVYGKPGPPPSIIVTTIETLNRRLHHPFVIDKLSVYLCRAVLDEIHLVEGIPGCHVIRLMDRLRQACFPRNILWTGSSATVASPDSHAATVFDVARQSVKVIEPNDTKLAIVGLVHHVFLRPTGNISFMGALVNSTSIVVHNRRDKIWQKMGKYEKTIGFVDNLDLLGRWNSDLRENERTENTISRPHPDFPNPKDWKSALQREIPYALRFQKPLERRINAEGGGKEDARYEPVLSEFKGLKICNECREGKRRILKTVTRDELEKLGQLVYREPHNPKDNVKKFYIKNEEIFRADTLQIGTLDLCPYLRAGACFWFAQDDFEAEEILKGFKPRYEWKSVARSKVHSSKTDSRVKLDDDLSEIIFTASMRDVYDLPNDNQIPIDVVIASPSLEVGIDLPNVANSLMFKAIRNVASYRQKAGRIGREEGSNSLNTTLISLRPIDLHYYRQPRKIISQAQLEPIALKDHNDAILRSALYMAAWDYLALKTNVPEVIPLGESEKGFQFTEKLISSKSFLEHNKNDLALYLSKVSRGRYTPQDDIISQITEQIIVELDVFLTSTAGTILDTKCSHISDMIVRFLNPSTPKVIAPKPSWNIDSVKLGADYYKKIRPNIAPITIGLSNEFQKLDLFDSSGWIDADSIRQISNKIVSQIDKLNIANRREDTQKLAFLIDHCLNTIITGLENMKNAGESPIVVCFYQQYDKFKRENKSWPYYMSYTLQGLPIFGLFKKHSSFMTPPNLFVNPYEPKVALYQRGEVIDSIPVSEALFSFIPGTWTFRLGKAANKTLVGKLEPHEGGVLYAKLAEMMRQGDDFKIIKKHAPAPPGFPSCNLTIYMPTKLTLWQIIGKYVNLNEKHRMIVDKDEDFPISALSKEETEMTEDEDENEYSVGHKKVRIPESHLDRWVHVIADLGTKILVNETDQEKLVVEGPNGVKGLDARQSLLHPLLSGIISSVIWHDRLEIYDYVCSVSRAYTSKTANNAVLMFEDEQGGIAFGQYFCTEGVSFELSQSAVEQAVSKMKSEMLGFNNKWAPSLLKALNAAISSKRLPDGSGVSPIIVNELLGVLIATVSSNLGSRTIVELPETLKRLLSNEDDFIAAAKKFYEGKYLIGLSEEDYESKITEQDKQDIKKQVDKLTSFALTVSNLHIDVTEGLAEWLTLTLLNTFGLTCLSALQRLSGSKDEDVGYTIDIEGIQNKKYRVFLYDRTENGNGSCDVLRRYMYIMNIQRHRQSDQSRLLPTEDFLSILEQELLQCPQFHTDMDALEKFNQEQDNVEKDGLPELGYVSDYSTEVLDVCRPTWKKLGLTGRNDAWRLPLIALSPGSFAAKFGLEKDDIMRATTICWNGCPECVINTNAIIGFLGTTFVDKLVLDEWFSNARTLVSEYKILAVSDVASGQARIDIGRQTRACIELSNRRIRSISLPFTIGLELERCKNHPHADLIVRDGDVHGLRLFGEKFDGCAHGLESFGFKRIMWYNLMMTAYLDVLGLLDDSRKEIILVFYDCRDVDFDDIGISNRMMEAIEYHRKKSGFSGEIRNLSDLILWLAKSDFRISICVDENRAREMVVHAFLEKLYRKNNNITLRVKGLPGSMHKKALLSPVGVIHGSANLTFSGTQLSEEIISYAPFGTAEYNEMRINLLDTFHGSKIWDA